MATVWMILPGMDWMIMVIKLEKVYIYRVTLQDDEGKK